MIDAIHLLRVGVPARRRRVEDTHGEQEIRILEPLQVLRHRRLRHLVAERLEIAREAVDGVERGRVIHQPVGQIGHGPRVGDVVPLDQIAIQDGVEVLLVDPDPQVPAESGDLGKASPLPVLVECLDDREAPAWSTGHPRRRSPGNPGTPGTRTGRSPTPAPARGILGRDLPRQKLRRRAGEVDLASLGAQQAVDERLPARSRLDLVEEAVHGLGVLLLRVEGEVRFDDPTEVAAPQAMQPVVEEVEVEDVPASDALLQQTRDQLVEVGRLATAAYADADRRLARNRLDAQAPGHACLKLHLLGVQDHGLEGFQERP